MTVEELARRLESDAIVSVSAAEWASVSAAFQEVERHPTYLAGDLVLVRVAGGLVAVEEPRSEERILRRLADEDEARRFVQGRLETYERMWDGCGCKVDYYG